MMALSWRKGLKFAAKQSKATRRCFTIVPAALSSEPAEQSYMFRLFIIHARFIRFFGCLFIGNMKKGSLKNARMTWKSPYLIYSIAWLATLTTMEGITIASKATCLSDKSCKFSESIGFIAHVVAAVKWLFNFLCLAFGSRRLLDFLRDAAELEKSTGFVPEKRSICRYNGRAWFKVVLRSAMLATAVSCFSLVFLMHCRMFSGERKHWHPLLKALAVLSSVALLFCESYMYMSLVHFCGVLAQYLRAQVATFEECRRMTKATTLAYVACGLQNRRSARQRLQDKGAQGGHQQRMESFHVTALALVDTWIAVTYTAYSTLGFVDFVLTSSDLASEVRKLKDAVKDAALLEPTNPYSHQVQYLHDIIEPDEMCLTAGGFFRLDRSLLVTMAGSVITFTVILVQTSDDIKHRMRT
ncbi:hypothetical protein V5799_004762 [Amblyomma americanum]|uniref:Gustatory receptor n=1 Tax=Amblyomma americanum TaxID=6943 RepID=A0AAQ4D565_AMBAM